MGKYDVKSYATIIFLSFALVTILNVLLHAAFPDIPIIKTGFGLILLLISIVLIMLFSFASDGKFEKEEIYAILVIVAIMVGIYFVVKNFVPDLFTIIPESLKEVFSIVP